jgi:uncharacterized protein (TIGR00725 family)
MIAVIGAGECDNKIYQLAYNTGKLLGKNGFNIICGGLGGVMEAVSKGVKEGGGNTVGILPGENPNQANSYIDFPIATGMGIGRNIIIIRSAQLVIAINGKYGTLSEIAFALQLGKPVIGLQSWDVSEDITKVESPEDCLLKTKEILKIA